MFAKMLKINIFKMYVWTFCIQLQSCYAFYILPKCIVRTDGLTLITEKNFIFLTPYNRASYFSQEFLPLMVKPYLYKYLALAPLLIRGSGFKGVGWIHKFIHNLFFKKISFVLIQRRTKLVQWLLISYGTNKKLYYLRNG